MYKILCYMYNAEKIKWSQKIGNFVLQLPMPIYDNLWPLLTTPDNLSPALNIFDNLLTSLTISLANSDLLSQTS